MAISRYRQLITPQRTMQTVPGIIISKRDTDKFIIYNSDKMRFDTIAADIYGDDLYSWLLSVANPEFPLEFDIQNNSVIRVPFPLNDVITEYEQKVITLKNK
ncbi:MAG TPA: hypothetical protein VNX68_14010 [Nitrosopumilaceae archaeon]|jgi:hypothetical protein|nr:hypothetical protein [Nitrosopumilaceae archaeon]